MTIRVGDPGARRKLRQEGGFLYIGSGIKAPALAKIISGGEVGRIDGGEIGEPRAGGICVRGNREKNDDSLIIVRKNKTILLAVADGIGGMPYGEIASKTAVETLSRSFLNDNSFALENAYEKAHEMILEEGKKKSSNMGTTLVSALIEKDRVTVANLGDSRAYLIREKGISLLTPDDNTFYALFMEEKGRIGQEIKFPFDNVQTAEYYEASRRSNNPILFGALGIISLSSKEGRSVPPFILDFKLKKGDTLILTSDGLHYYLEFKEFMRVINADQKASAARIAWALMKALKTQADNITIAVFKNF